jgi:hypothetical protein
MGLSTPSTVPIDLRILEICESSEIEQDQAVASLWRQNCVQASHPQVPRNLRDHHYNQNHVFGELRVSIRMPSLWLLVRRRCSTKFVLSPQTFNKPTVWNLFLGPMAAIG